MLAFGAIPSAKTEDETKGGQFLGVGQCFACGRGRFVAATPCAETIAGGKRKIPTAKAGTNAPQSQTPRGEDAVPEAPWAGSIPGPHPWDAAGMQQTAWRGPRGKRIGHFTHRLPKMVAPTFFFPLSATVSARMHPRGGEGEGPQPPAREGTGNRSQDGIRGRN